MKSMNRFTIIGSIKISIELKGENNRIYNTYLKRFNNLKRLAKIGTLGLIVGGEVVYSHKNIKINAN